MINPNMIRIQEKLMTLLCLLTSNIVIKEKFFQYLMSIKKTKWFYQDHHLMLQKHS